MSKSTPVVVMVCAFAACGGDDAPVAEDAPGTVEAAMAQVTEAVRARTGDVEPISAEVLQSRLPDELDGLERVDVSRTETGAVGLTVSTTNARYEGDERRSVTIAITDVGGMGAMGVMSGAAWAMTEYDRTTQTGYDRTSRFEGFKALESLSREGGVLRTELSILVAERFIVQLEGREVEMDVLRDAARRLRLRDLAGEG